ncbi:TOBE domain-containing protein [Methylophaga sulfidovorans]|uniref:Molybdate transport system regulatory protein n=1 Tax=Methylophaga sulfidovorans TaxID=45496 RepID=A0A1I3UM86_9GAMM|nr:TOBE domain-containing protein [Methylophaga sulfidovorans]SFJ83773.1 molybdate transport system regulatory protein [Methylophaga sulfidovorans]
MTERHADITSALFSRGRKYDHMALLEQIDVTGSIRAAASALGMSYKTAWDAIEAINNMADSPLVERRKGGRDGGGARLTAHGRRLITTFHQLDQERARVLHQLNEVIDDFDAYYQLIRRFDLKTSARNQFLGKVKTIKQGEISNEVILDIGGDDEIVANITSDSLEHLKLKQGTEAYAMIKASWVILTLDHQLKTSARNKLTGKVARCHEGAINTEVIIELNGGKTLAATITNDSANELQLKPETPVTALIKASNVILAVAN